MKTTPLLPILLAVALSPFAAGVSRAQDIDSIAPVVVKTVPEAGLKDVAPGEAEIKVTFSKEMTDGIVELGHGLEGFNSRTRKHQNTGNHKTCVR